MKDILQLKVSLHQSSPEIWRRILVDKGTTLFDLHHILQITMGWQNYHLYEFKINKQRFGIPNDDFEDAALIDASQVKLEDVLTNDKQKFEYLYDFGDYWRHNIVYEKSLEDDGVSYYPVCTDGELSAPPEDCGGLGGYHHLIQVISSKDYPDHEDMVEWVGEEFDPNFFDKTMINEELEMLDEYIDDYLDGLND